MAAAENTAAEMAKCRGRADIEAYQVCKFNVVWSVARQHVPFYREWQTKFNLPNNIERLEELEGWPVLTKADLRKIDLFERDDVAEPTSRLMTGGSTGEPVRLPTWGDPMAGVMQAIGRHRYGIAIGDPVFLLWGHEHLYGTGIHRKLRAYKRRFKDWLAGWKRVSAYDLSSDAMHKAYAAFVKSDARLVIGFSPAVLAFVKTNRKMRLACNAGFTPPKAILCTAGPLTDDEKQEISDFFCAPVLMEYGSVECGIMAYTRPSDGNYGVFWNTHLLQAQKQPDGEYKNLVTRLTNCYVPMIRYDIGDYLDAPDDEHSVLFVRNIKGRPSEMLHFACGVTFFGALIGDCVKQVPEVVSSQIGVDEANNVLEIRVVSNSRLSREALDLIKNRFALTVADASKLKVRVVQVEKLFTTVGGKTPRVVRL